MNIKHGCTINTDRHIGNPRWRAHVSWQHLRQRCRNANGEDYPNYGGRGIAYDPEWEDFEAFLSDMGTPPPGMSIERIDNDGPYAKWNCTWADRRTQSLNRRNARVIEHDGKAMRVADWAKHLGVPVQRLKNRLHRGWPLERVLVSDDYSEVGRFKPKVDFGASILTLA